MGVFYKIRRGKTSVSKHFIHPDSVLDNKDVAAHLDRVHHAQSAKVHIDSLF